MTLIDTNAVEILSCSGVQWRKRMKTHHGAKMFQRFFMDIYGYIVFVRHWYLLSYFRPHTSLWFLRFGEYLLAINISYRWFLQKGSFNFPYVSLRQFHKDNFLPCRISFRFPSCNKQLQNQSRLSWRFPGFQRCVAHQQDLNGWSVMSW